MDLTLIEMALVVCSLCSPIIFIVRPKNGHQQFEALHNIMS